MPDSASPDGTEVVTAGLPVAVVVDGEWRRRGLAAGVAALGGVLESAWTGPTDQVPTDLASGIALVGVDTDGPWDHLAGLHAVAAVSRGHDMTTVAIATDLGNPMLALRAAEAGAAVLCAWDEVNDLRNLERVMLTPPLDWRPERRLDFAALRALGVSPTGRPGAGLAMLEAEGLRGALDGSDSVELSRRQTITLRRRLSEEIGVRVAGPVTASSNQPTIPSWQQLRQIVDLARGAAPPA